MIFYLVIILLVSAGIAVLFSSHYFIFYTLLHLFPTGNYLEKNTLIIIIILLAISFFISFIIAHIKENNFTRLLYFASGFWLGLLVNLVLASTAVWLVFFLSPLNQTSTATLVATFYAAAFIYSLYGVWNAMHPQLKNIAVAIPNLPPHWKGKKIVQISDVHIGHIHKNTFIKDIAQKINSANPEMVVITGDLFDGMDGGLDNPLKALNDIKSNKGIFFITGNHETILGTEFVKKELEKTKIRMINDEVIDVDGLKLIGINYPEHGETRDAVAIIEKIKDQYFGQPNILLYHSPVNIKKFKEKGINVQLSGHSHNGQLFPLNYISKIFFKGHSYGLHQMENYTLYVTNGTGTWGPAMRTGSTPEIVVITLQ